MHHVSNMTIQPRHWQPNDWGLTIRFDAGEYRVWFVLAKDELCEIAKGERAQARDGYHHLDIQGDRWTFYHLELPYQQHNGKHEVKFAHVEIPHHVAKILYRWARLWARKLAARDEKSKYDDVPVTKIDVGQKARWLKRYGRGKGQVAVSMSETTAAFLGEKMSPKLAEQVEYVKQVARNSTRTYWESASLSLSKDWDGFYWVAKTPSGRMIMNGGIVNHSREEGGEDWSIHT